MNLEHYFHFPSPVQLFLFSSTIINLKFLSYENSYSIYQERKLTFVIDKVKTFNRGIKLYFSNIYVNNYLPTNIMFDNIIPPKIGVAFYEIKHPNANNNPTLMHKSLYIVPTPCRLFVTIIRRGEYNNF